MFESSAEVTSAEVTAESTFAGPAADVTSGEIAAWVLALGDGCPRASDAELIDRIRALEELKASASAAQARAAAAFDASQRRIQEAAGLPQAQLGKGVASQLALARRESANRGGRLLGFAKALTAEMPCTLHALSRGLISEWRATLLVRETACLTVADRRAVDREVAGNPDVLETLGDRQIIARAKAAVYRLDPQAAVRRAAHAVSDRYVSCRPAPDTMTYLTGLLPVSQGVGVYAALSREADRLRATGDGRGRGQIMADTLVERITGQSPASRVDVEVQLVMTDRALFAGGSKPGVVPGYGPVPAQWARDLIRNSPSATYGSTGKPGGPMGKGRAKGSGKESNAGERTTEGKARTWLRRLYTAPDTGELIAMDSRARLFPAYLSRFIAVRDQTCRMPWCGAPIRHIDHVQPHRDGGPTSAGNGQGLCEACNHAKEAPGWSALPVQPAGDGHTVETRTPTGHTYRSTAPPMSSAPPGSKAPPQPMSPAETALAAVLRAA